MHKGSMVDPDTLRKHQRNEIPRMAESCVAGNMRVFGSVALAR